MKLSLWLDEANILRERSIDVLRETGGPLLNHSNL